MDFSEVIASRRAIRKYKGDGIPQETLQKLYRALQLAPSGNNHQPYKFIFVVDKEKRMQIAEKACHQDFIKEAPVLMIACCEKGRSFDTAIAVDHMILAATAEGLGTCWVGWFERDVVKEVLNIPGNMETPILVPIGYKDEDPEPKLRKDIAELIGIDGYNE